MFPTLPKLQRLHNQKSVVSGSLILTGLAICLGIFLLVTLLPTLAMPVGMITALAAGYLLAARQRHQTAQRYEADLEALRQTSLQLTASLELEPVLSAILDQALKLVNADDAHLYLYDGTRLSFSAAIWDGQRRTRPFKEPRPHGITYTTARSAVPLIISSGQPDPRFPEWNQKAVVALPLRIGAQVCGIMTVAFQRPHSFNNHELNLLGFLADQAAVAIQNAQLYETTRHQACYLEQRVVDETQKAQEHQQSLTMGLRAVLAAADELISCEDLNQMMRRAVELPRERLGVERCAIFLLDETDCFNGTYGTDMQGRTTDEHAVRFDWAAEMTPDTWRTPVKREGPQWVHYCGPLRTWDGEATCVVGEGWVCATPIQSTAGLIGVFSNDAAISGAPLDETRQDVLSVYCSLLGKIMERRQMEEEIRRALQKEKDLGELRSRFVTTISHEFRTPLAVILSSAQLLQFYGSRMNAERAAQHWAEIEKQIRTMTALMEDVLTVGKSENGGLNILPVPLDLDAFCESLSKEMQIFASESLQVSFACEGAHPTRLADERLLRLILVNLLTNAIKYSPPGTCVQFHVRCETDHVIFSVCDQGIGIPKADHAHLFDLFYRGQNVETRPGTGLGLPIVRRAVDACEGTITFESQVNVGTRFTVTLPLPIPAACAVSAAE